MANSKASAATDFSLPDKCSISLKRLVGGIAVYLAYTGPDGPGPVGRHVHGTKKPGTSTARHGGNRAAGQPGTTVGPCLGRCCGVAKLPSTNN
jgi:hypothetical protein